MLDDRPVLNGGAEASDGEGDRGGFRKKGVFPQEVRGGGTTTVSTRGPYNLEPSISL